MEYVRACVREWLAFGVGVGGGILGLVAGIWPAFNVPAWAWATVCGVGLFMAQFFAFHRLRTRLERYESRVPRNRDALVAAISNLETKAQGVTTEVGLLGYLQSRDPDIPYPKPEGQVRRAKEEYGAADTMMTKERRIAGAQFQVVLHLFQAEVHMIVLESVDDEEKRRTANERIRERTEAILRAIDEGRVFVSVSRSANSLRSRLSHGSSALLAACTPVGLLRLLKRNSNR